MAKPLIMGIGLGVVTLLVLGFIVGAIGQKFITSPASISALSLDAPAIHLPAQAVYPVDKREEAIQGANLGFTGFAITNTMMSSFAATLVLILVLVVGARKKRLIPGRFQCLVELIVESLFNFVEGVSGKEMARRFFPVVATIFLFVVFNAWMGLLPFYPAWGFDPQAPNGGVYWSSGQELDLDAASSFGSHDSIHQESAPTEEPGIHVSKVDLFRPAGTDINMPLALAIVAFVFVEFWGFKVLGLGYLSKFIRVRNLFRGPKYLFTALIDLFVGILETLSELIRVVSFTFRLFGNMLAGEILILVSAFLIPFVFSVPFYGLELLVGFIQAMIFMGLTVTFAAVAVAHHED